MPSKMKSSKSSKREVAAKKWIMELIKAGRGNSAAARRKTKRAVNDAMNAERRKERAEDQERFAVYAGRRAADRRAKERKQRRDKQDQKGLEQTLEEFAIRRKGKAEVDKKISDYRKKNYIRTRKK